MYILGIVLLCVVGGLAVILAVRPLRRLLITQHLMRWFIKQQPPLSQSEQEALQAGGLWWEAEFFSGRPDWQKLFAIEKPELTLEEQHFLDNQVATLCKMLNDWEITNELKDLPKPVWEYLKKERFFGLVIDKQHGGLGFSAVAHSAVVTMIASVSYSAAVTVMVPNSLGPAELLQEYGTAEQQAHYLPRLACGDDIPCFALTSPVAGSDASSITDTGIVTEDIYQGQKVLGIKLNFDKRYITLAPKATLIGLAFQLKDPNHLLGDNEEIGITLALLPANLPGISNGTRHYAMNLGIMNGPIRGSDVFIPLDNIIGGAERAGRGWAMLMEALAAGRGISLPALATAGAQVCFRTTGAYAKLRQQFRRSIGDFEGVQQALAKIGGLTYLMEATRGFTALAVAKNLRPAVATAITKYHVTELGRDVVNLAMDVHAGRTVMAGPKNYLANLYMSAPMSITVEGANILTRNLLIFGQGVIRCHPFLLREIDAAGQQDVETFDRLIFAHLRFMLRISVSSSWHGFTAGRFIRSPVKDRTRKYYKQLTRMSSAFAMITEVTLVKLGARLKFNEALSARLGDALSYFYLASSALKYYRDNNANDDDYLVLSWALEYCLY